MLEPPHIVVVARDKPGTVNGERERARQYLQEVSGGRRIPRLERADGDDVLVDGPRPSRVAGTTRILANNGPCLAETISLSDRIERREIPLARSVDRAYSGDMRVSFTCAAARAIGSPVAAA